MSKKQKKVLNRIIATAVLLIVWHLLFDEGLLSEAAGGGPLYEAVHLAAYLAVYLLIGHDILKKAVHGIRNRQPFDECFLMTVATLGAMLLGDFNEGCAVMLFYQTGEFFQSYAVGKSRRNITKLMDIRPDVAYVEQSDGSAKARDPDDVAVGTVIVVRPGEKVPIDGVVLSGESMLDTAALTGESVPRSVRPGDEIISGSVNEKGVLKIRTTKEFGESTVSKILDLVENASSRKSRTEAFISRFARIYTPIVCFSALALALCVPTVRVLLHCPAEWLEWIYRALIFLVISCPCALVISIPLTFFAAIGGAGRRGILVKGSSFLEALSEVKYVLFDKTGTLTKGVFEVTDVIEAGASKDRIIEYAAHAEGYSTHPVSESIRTMYTSLYGRDIDLSRVSDAGETSGEGVEAVVGGVRVAVGNRKLMEREGVRFEECHEPGTVVYVALDDEYAGAIVISDRIKETGAEAVRLLRQNGVKKTFMLTGDARSVAESAARTLGIDEVYPELLPAQKVAKVEEVISGEGPREKTAFVGDGINDAPVLMRADVGIAMGALGSDAAIEAADIVLMDDRPEKIALAVRISKKCMGIVYQNICFAIGVKAACLLLGALGIANMWAAIFADVGVMVIAVLNAVRALYIREA